MARRDGRAGRDGGGGRDGRARRDGGGGTLSAAPPPRFTERLREAARPVWEAQLRHPFVRGIGDGTLEVARFRRWVVQDYLYLKEFARVFAWAAARAERLESMSWYAAALDLTLNTEMELHREYAARFGLDRDRLEGAEMWPTTRAYTDFLVRTAAGEGLPELLAALLPCAWGYAWVARRLSGGEAPEDDRYADWIEMYTSADFRDAATWMREEMDRVAAGIADETRLGGLERTFVLSSRYEWLFWEMCWEGESWSP